MPNYNTSQGIKLSSSVIDRRIVSAKADLIEGQLIEYGYNFCERTKHNKGVLDCSHIMSVKFCKENGISDYAYDVRNLEVLCRDSHMEIESLSAIERIFWFFEKNSIPYNKSMNVKECLNLLKNTST